MYFDHGVSPFIGVKKAQLPIYSRRFIGVIYNSIYNDRRGPPCSGLRTIPELVNRQQFPVGASF